MPASFGKDEAFDLCTIDLISTLGIEICPTGNGTDLIVQAYHKNKASRTVCEAFDHTWYYRWTDANLTPLLCGQGQSVLPNMGAGTYYCTITFNSLGTIPDVTLSITVEEKTTYTTVNDPAYDIYWSFDGAGSATPAGTGIGSSGSALGINDANNNKPWTARFDLGPPAAITGNCACNASGPVQYSNMSVEFWAKFLKYELSGYQMDIMRPSSSCQQFWTLRLGPDELSFGSMGYLKDIPMDGADRKSIAYYMDESWHHFAMTFDEAAGEIKLYVDGESHPDFQIHFSGSSTIYNKRCGRVEFDIDGELDELAFYFGDATNSGVLSPSTVDHHHSEKKELPQITSSPSNDPCDFTSIPDFYPSLNALDFPPGYDPNDPNETGASLEDTQYQVSDAPSPRYFPDHDLKRIFPWLHTTLYRTYGGGANGQASAELMETFADDWHQFMVLPRGNGPQNSHHYNLFNDRLDLPLGYISLWPQAYPRNLHPALPTESMINHVEHRLNSLSNNHLASNHYIPGSSSFSPVAPRHFLNIDGKAVKHELDGYLNHLDRSIELVSENGEVQINIDDLPTFQNHIDNTSGSELELDFNAFAIPSANCTESKALEYYADVKTQWRQHYLDEVLNQDPRLQNTSHVWYSIDGRGGHFATEAYELWHTVRNILPQDPENGYRYASADMYVGTPAQWWLGTGVSHGMGYYYNFRRGELCEGDKLCAPYVNAGYRGPNKGRPRPGQWLGLLKLMAVYGAETYYPGFFVADEDPRLWIWQLMVPSYAQAVTSRYEHELRNGDVLQDSNGDYIFNVRNHLHDPSIPIAVRKSTSASPYEFDNNYIIASTRQPFTNQNNSHDLSTQETDVLVTDFDNMGELRFIARRQGSVYVYRQDAIHSPVFYQLDGWHESSHPNHWSKDFVFEAEVYDGLENNGQWRKEDSLGRKTKIISNLNEVDPLINGPNDFRKYVTYMSFVNADANPKSFQFHNGPALSYHFQVKSGDPNQTFTYTLQVRARGHKLSSGTTGLFYALYDKASGEMITSNRLGCIGNTGWQWYSKNACGGAIFQNLPQGDYILKLVPESEWVEIDKIILDESSQANSVTVIPCSESPQPTVHFEYKADCDGGVQFLNQSMPLEACPLPSYPFRWNFGNGGPVVQGNGPLTGVTNGSGTFENPHIVYSGPGPVKAKAGMVFPDGSFILDTIDIVLPTAPSLAANEVDPSICEGDEVSLSVTGSGGTGQLSYQWLPSITASAPHSATTDLFPRSTTDYAVVVLDENGCSDTLDRTVTVNPSPVTISGLADVSYPESDINIISHNVVATVSGGTGPYAYTWTPGSLLSSPQGSSASGSISTTIGSAGNSTDETNIGTALVSLEVSDANNCHAESSFLFTLSPSSNKAMFEEERGDLESEKVKFSIFPNPTSGMVTVLHDFGQVRCEVLDLQGKVLRSMNSAEKSFDIDFGGLPGGVYLIQLFDGKVLESSKVIVVPK